MTLKKLDLLTLLISLFILSGCENPSGIGLDVDPDLALSSDTVTLNVQTKLLKEDSIATNFTERSVLAYIKDNTFGETTASMALALTLPTTNVSFGTNPQLDSAVLVLPFTAAALYGDSLAYTAEVKQLNEALYTETQKVYYSNKVWNKKDDLIIGSKVFMPSYRDSTTIKVYGEADSTIKVIPQLRIPLNSTFISQNILSLDSATLSTSKKFADSFRGLYVSLNKASAPVNGGSIAFDTYTAGAARVDIYYRTTNSSGTIDTLIKSLPINGTSGAAVTEIKWTPSAEVKAQLNKVDPDKLYFKGFAGTKVNVSFPTTELNKLKASGKSIAINRAELLITAEEPAQPSLLPLSLIRIYKWDIANQPKPIPDENQNDPRYMGPGYVGGFYNKDNKTYAINITGYIQDIVSGKTPEYGTFLTTFDYLNNTGRLNFPGSVISEGGSGTSPNRVKLKIYYTDLK